MWINSKPLNAMFRQRPARIAYLIPEEPPHALLDTLIDESLSRWGGRRTPLIPTNGKSIEPAYWGFLNLWDADIIYSYVKLSEELERRLFRIFAPSEVRLHSGLMEHQDAHGLRPEYTGNFSFLSSLSLLPLFARRSQIQGVDLPQIVDKERWVKTDRDLDDSFGFVSNSHSDHSLLPYARRLSLRPNPGDPKIAKRFAEPNEISYLEDTECLLKMIVERHNLLTVSRLSDLFCPHLHHPAWGQESWDDHLTIVIGDQISDRLLFWNVQHRYQALGGSDDIPVLRLSPKRFQNNEPPSWLKDLIAVRNRRHLHGNQAPRTVLRSCSLSKEQIDAIAKTLSGKRMVMISSEHHPNSCVFDACQKYTSDKRKGLMVQFPSIWIHPSEYRQSTIHFQNNQFELPMAPPWHIRDVSPMGLTSGVWAVDLCIERAEDHSQFSNLRHVWKWPRRLRLEQAIRFENYASGPHRLALPPLVRPTEYGDVSIWDCAAWSRPTLHLPTDYQAFTHALLHYVPGSPETKKASEEQPQRFRFNQVTVSDKGRDLLGVFQFFMSLPEALAFLTDNFWCEVIRRLSPEEPANNKCNISTLAGKIREMIEQGVQEASHFKRLAQRALSLAARSFSSQSEQLKSADFKKLLCWAKGNGQDRGGEIEKRLEESVTYLRDRDFLWQGYGWRCDFCQHQNWIPLERLSPISKCEICRKPKSSPVSGSLHFRLNPFVHHAFAPTSAQGPVIWCLDHLAHRAKSSFSFAPTLDVYRLGKTNPETDIDILAVVDGQVYIVEVKSSFAGEKAEVLKQLKRLAEELCPDVVMLAVMANSLDSGEWLEITKAFRLELEVYDVCFELLTLDQTNGSTSHDRIALPLAKHMEWSAW